MSDEEKLAGAALNLKQVGDTSVPVILNIIGNDKMRQWSRNDVTFSSYSSLVLIQVFQLNKTNTLSTGLENTKSGNYEEAFICFKAASEQGYSKAQFNVGVCYEKGRGVHKDREKVCIFYSTLKEHILNINHYLSFCKLFPRILVKALHYYWQAAVGGHRQAQYRHAKLILSIRGQQSAEELKTAISFLEQSATAGLIEV